MDPILEEFINSSIAELLNPALTNTYDDARIATLGAINSALYQASDPQKIQKLVEAEKVLQSIPTSKDFLNFVTNAAFIDSAKKSGVDPDLLAKAVEQAGINNTPIIVNTSIGQQIRNAPKFDSSLFGRLNVAEVAKSASSTIPGVPTAAFPQTSAPSPASVRAPAGAPTITGQAARFTRTALDTAPQTEASVANSQSNLKFLLTLPGAYIASKVRDVLGRTETQFALGTGFALASLWEASKVPATDNNTYFKGLGSGIFSSGSSATPTAAKSAPEIPIGPSAMQNLPSAAPPGPSADVQRRTALKDQLRNAPDSTAKWDAYASVLYEEIVANDEELAKVRQELDTLPATATDLQKQALAIRLNTANTNRISLRDDYTKSLENKDKAAKEAVANSPENLALVRQATQASIDAQSASAAASRASAARSAVEAAAIEAKRIRDEQMGPVELAAAEQSLKNAQILGAKAEVDLQLIQADQRQRAAVDVLQSKFDAGELTEEQFTTQALAASGKIEQLATYRLNLQRNQDAREQAAIQQGNWEKSFGLQQQAAAIAQTEAVANREFRQSQLALQQAAEARAAAQARAQNMQALTAAQTQRQAAYNQAATEYERYGVATPNRIQGLQDLKAPLPAAQAAGMLGLDVNSPEFKAVYDTYSMALSPGQGAQQPTQPDPVTPAPAPVPNPVTNSIPLISMPTMGNTPYLTQALGGLKTGYSPA